MSDIAKIDKNFEVRGAEGGMVYRDIESAPFKIYGLLRDDDGYCRMPLETAAAVSDSVCRLSRCTAGGRVRFVSDAQTVCIRAKMKSVGKMPHFAFTGSAGFDLYADNMYAGTFAPPIDIKDGYESQVKLQLDKKLYTFCINFPLYSGVVRLEVGLPEGSLLLPAPEYGTRGRIVYYGSSITQGACACRPGTCYQSIITRMLDCDHLNLGFSGAARAEDAAAQYIAGLDMRAFVYDYDHNAPDAEYLEKTHEPMFKTIRRAQPQLPIIMLSRPQPRQNGEEKRRRDIIMRTYLNARDGGDDNVYFIDGGTFAGDFGGDGTTVDNIHPNDLGFMCMAHSVGRLLKEILK